VIVCFYGGPSCYIFALSTLDPFEARFFVFHVFKRPPGEGGWKAYCSDSDLVWDFRGISNLERVFSGCGNEQEPQGKRADRGRSP
jgi:hypothetical protein